MSEARRGEIWYVYTPGQPDDPHQPRPALIVSEDLRNRFRDNLIVVPAFSRGRIGPAHVVLPAGVGGIPHDSVLFCEEITTIAERFLVDGPLGRRVPELIVQQVLRGVMRALGEPLPEPS